jgi:pyruvate kinase
MMAKIAAASECQQANSRRSSEVLEYFKGKRNHESVTIADVISLNVLEATQTLPVRYILTPTYSGSTPRRISRFKPDCWILSFTHNLETHGFLMLSYGVYSCVMDRPEGSWDQVIQQFVKERGLAERGENMVITEGISSQQGGWTNSMRIITMAD